LIQVSTLILILFAASSCVRRDGQNADCQWPGENPLQNASAIHLSADAEFAEDLAIRYADKHFGLSVPGDVYVAERDRCMVSLFEPIAAQHGVSTAQVAGSLGRNRLHIDLAVNLPFAILYLLAAWFCVRLIWRRYPPAEIGWAPGLMMTLFVSLALATGCVLLGEMWSWITETYRVGNDHMSYRAVRLVWRRYRPEMFAGALASFWLAAAIAARGQARVPSTPLTQTAP
jgi:hypothetical protein